MNSLFERTSSYWVRYEEYEWKTAADGKLYLTPAKDAKPSVFDPLKEAEALVVDALNIGRLCISRKPDAQIQGAMLDYAKKYGLLGLMTALPTTPKFMDYEAVYLPKNHFITAETMPTADYVALFFPFKKLDWAKKGVESLWYNDDKAGMALQLTFSDKPMAVQMSMQRSYAERYDWLKQQFTDWAFMFMTTFFYYEDYDKTTEETHSLYRQSMAAFDGIAPTYHIALYDKPTIVWDFHSLLLGIQMMFSFMLTDDRKPLRLCRNCSNVFMAGRANMQYCSEGCKKQYHLKNGKSTHSAF